MCSVHRRFVLYGPVKEENFWNRSWDCHPHLTKFIHPLSFFKILGATKYKRSFNKDIEIPLFSVS